MKRGAERKSRRKGRLEEGDRLTRRAIQSFLARGEIQSHRPLKLEEDAFLKPSQSIALRSDPSRQMSRTISYSPVPQSGKERVIVSVSLNTHMFMVLIKESVTHTAS
jgi:hypothetical protein